MRPTEPVALSDARTLAGPESAPRREQAGPPARLGRYLVLHELGRGGMGAVYLAYDPELDRKVAVKLLDAPDADSAQQDRLLREAQAMARLAHPNVATVFDVGVLGGQVYLAMEYVEGETLRAWLATPRPWRQVVATFAQAGRGLAAAHAVGLVHRDFKPDNAIVGRDGRIRVLDFGLAALGTTLSEETGQAPATLTSLALPGLASRSLLSSRLTAAGAIVGTLAYMSPEQLTADEIDPRSDQFSFCVALFEALHAGLPFAGDTAGAYALAVTSGAVRTPPRGAVPRWLDRVILRGLAPRRDDRWPDMDRLLAALTRDPAVARRRLGLVGLAIATSVGVGLLASRRGDDACSGVDEPIAAAWSVDTRARIHAAVTATNVPYAADTLARVLPGLDAWAARWSAARRAVCTDHHSAALTDALHDREVTCLSGQVHDLVARTRLLAAADATAVTHAVAAVEALPDPARCRDPALLGDHADPAAEARLREADAEQDLGHWPRARELAAAAVAQAPGDAALAEALYLEASVLHGLGQPREARAGFVRAFTRAAAVGQREQAFRSVSYLLLVTADDFLDLDQAALWNDIGVELQTGGGLDPLLVQNSFPSSQALYAAARGDYDEALAHFARADAWTRAERDPLSLAAANIALNRARVLRMARRYAAAESEYMRVREIFDHLLGPHHPQQAVLANNLGVLYSSLDRHVEALRELERAGAIVRAIEGPSSAHLASIDSNSIEPYIAAGRHDDAVAAARRAVEMFEHEMGPGASRVATAYNNLGHALLSTDRCDEARLAFEKSLEIFQGTTDPVPTDLSTPLYNLGYCALVQRDYAAAEAYTTRGLAALADLTDDSERDHLRFLHSRALLGLGRHREAVDQLTEVLAHWEKTAPIPDRRGDARFVRAQALWADKKDREHATQEARAARELLKDSRSPMIPLAEVDAWLAAHAPAVTRP